MKSIRCALAISAFVLTALAAVAPAQESAWTSHGPTDVGWINDLAIADSVAYAATLNGVFRSNDGGVSWQQSGLAGQSLFQIVARPGAAVVLALSYSYDENLYVSRDGGQTWTPVPGLPSVITAAIDPGHPSTLYAVGVDGTIWKSADSGTSWLPFSTVPGGSFGGPATLAFDSRAIYLLTSNQLFKSLDGGVTWTPAQPPPGGPSAIAAGTAAGVVYAAAGNSVCKSTDSAATWTCSTSFLPGYVSHILEVPGDSPTAPPRLLVSSSEGVLLSSDVGATWTRVQGLDANAPVLGSDASGSLVLAGTDSQVFRSEDHGDSWKGSSAGLRSVWISALALDPHDPSTVWAGGLGAFPSGPGLFRSVDSGLSWSRPSSPQGPRGASSLAIDPEHPATMYAAWDSVVRTDDGGLTWTSSNPAPGQGELNVVALDPDSSQRVWVGAGSGLFRSDDGAQTWEPTSIVQSVYCILFDDRHPDTIYAGSYFDVGDYGYAEGGSIFVSHDHGVSFTKGAQELPTAVTSIVADPFHDGVLYVAVGLGGVSRSADGGVTWVSASNGLPSPFGAPFGFYYANVLQLVADPVRPGHLYCSTDDGVFRTIDGARTWQAFSLGLTTLRAAPLVISPDGKRLHVGTVGGGIFELDLETEASFFPCTPSATRLCLVENRYAVDLVAARRGGVPNNPGAAQPLSDRAGYFALPFATNDPEFPEVVVKMLADGTFGVAGAPFFYSSLTTLPYVLTVTDTVTGLKDFYASDPDAPLCGGTDLPFGPAENLGPLSASAPVLAAAGETTLHLLGGRFSVTLEARRPSSGQTAKGVAMSSGDRFGFFSLPDFTRDPQFPEVAVKMIDARAATGEFWFFYTGLTSLDYTLTVTDSVTGAVRTYESATHFCGGADVKAFTD